MPLTRLRAWIAIGLALTGAAGAAQAPRPSPVAIPIQLNGRHLIVPVTVNGSAPLAFILDSGDRDAIVDLDRAKELGLTLTGSVRVGGVGSGQLAGAVVRETSFAIPGLDGFSQPVVMALPLSGLEPRLGRDLDGIIGAEFIKQFVVEVSYSARALRLHDKASFSYSGKGVSVPIDFDGNNHPLIAVTITPSGGEPFKATCMLDIGSGGALVLHSPLVAERHLPGPSVTTVRAIGMGGAGGAASGTLGRVSAIRIGPYSLDGPVTMFAEDRAGAFARESPQCNVGGQIANRFTLFFDYGRRRIIFEPNSTFGTPYDESMAGVFILAEGKDYRTFRIDEVLERSPAAEAGLQKDDVIAAVNDRPATSMTLVELRELFEHPVPYTLEIRRGDRTLKVSLTPRKLI